MQYQQGAVCPNCQNLLVEIQGEMRCPVGLKGCWNEPKPHVVKPVPCPVCGGPNEGSHACEGKEKPKEVSGVPDMPPPQTQPEGQGDSPSPEHGGGSGGGSAGGSGVDAAGAGGDQDVPDRVPRVRKDADKVQGPDAPVRDVPDKGDGDPPHHNMGMEGL